MSSVCRSVGSSAASDERAAVERVTDDDDVEEIQMAGATASEAKSGRVGEICEREAEWDCFTPGCAMGGGRLDELCPLPDHITVAVFVTIK